MTTAQVTTVLRDSACLNQSINLLEPFYQAVFGCYLSPETCGSGANSTNEGGYAVVTKGLLTTADACSLDATFGVCSIFGTEYHGACAATDMSCQMCLNMRDYSSDCGGCSTETLATAVACNATKLSCDSNVIASNDDCTNATIVADAVCKATAATCSNQSSIGVAAEYAMLNADSNEMMMMGLESSMSGMSSMSSMSGMSSMSTTSFADTDLSGCDTQAAMEIVKAYNDAIICSADASACEEDADTTAVTSCLENGPSCATGLAKSLMDETGATGTCTAASLAKGATCVDEVNFCVVGITGKCRLNLSVGAVKSCISVNGKCAAEQTANPAGCSNATAAAFGVCNTGAAAFSTQIFAADEAAGEAAFEFGDDVTVMTAGNPMGLKALGKNSKCKQKMKTCQELIDSNYKNTDIATACEDIGINPMTQAAYLEDTDYPTWAIWVRDVCISDDVRTPAPTAAPVTIAKVSKNSVFSTAEQATVCTAMNKVAFKDGVISVFGSLKCQQDQGVEVSVRRRLLTAETQTIYSIEGSISAVQALSTKEILAIIGVETFGAEISGEIVTADSALGAAATVSVTPLATDVPTGMPTMMPRQPLPRLPRPRLLRYLPWTRSSAQATVLHPLPR
jgi:hypothetical protein